MLNFFKSQPKTQADTLLRAYYNALNKAENSVDFAKKLQAFNDVIIFCSNDFGCLNDASRKRDMILYWTYNNLGDIYIEKAKRQNNKSLYDNAIENYQRALNFSRNTQEKATALKRLASLYEQNGDMNNFYTIKDILIESYPIEERREAFEKLADTTENTDKKIYFLEKALDFVRAENISARDHCHNTINICEKLRLLYTTKKDYINLSRIEELRTNTTLLIH